MIADIFHGEYKPKNISLKEFALHTDTSMHFESWVEGKTVCGRELNQQLTTALTGQRSWQELKSLLEVYDYLRLKSRSQSLEEEQRAKQSKLPMIQC